MAAYTKLRFADLDNGFAGKGGEFYMGREALESPQVGVTWIRLPAGVATQGEKGHFQRLVLAVVADCVQRLGIDPDRFAPAEAERVLLDPELDRATGDDHVNLVLVVVVIAVSGQLPESGDDSHPVEGFVPDW